MSENKYKYITDKREKVRRALYNDDIASKMMDHMSVSDAGKYLKAVHLMDAGANLNKWSDWEKKTSSGVNLANKKTEFYGNKFLSRVKGKSMDWPQWHEPKLTKIQEVYKFMKTYGHKDVRLWYSYHYTEPEDERKLGSLLQYLYNLMAIALHHGKRDLFYDLLSYHNRNTIWTFHADELFKEFQRMLRNGNSYMKKNVKIIFDLGNKSEKKEMIEYMISEFEFLEEWMEDEDLSDLEDWRNFNRAKLYVTRCIIDLGKDTRFISESEYENYKRRVTTAETKLKIRNWI